MTIVGGGGWAVTNSLQLTVQKNAIPDLGGGGWAVTEGAALRLYLARGK